MKLAEAEFQSEFRIERNLDWNRPSQNDLHLGRQPTQLKSALCVTFNNNCLTRPLTAPFRKLFSHWPAAITTTNHRPQLNHPTIPLSEIEFPEQQQQQQQQQSFREEELRVGGGGREGFLLRPEEVEEWNIKEEEQERKKMQRLSQYFFSPRHRPGRWSITVRLSGR